MVNLNNIKLGMVFVCALLIVSNSYANDLQRSTMQVSNLSCPSCVGKIESELKKIPGMVGMTTDLRKGIVQLDHGSMLVPAEISAAITKMGYPAQMLSTQYISRAEASYFGKSAAFCGAGGCGGSNNCGAAGSAWKELYRKFTKKPPK